MLMVTCLAPNGWSEPDGYSTPITQANVSEANSSSGVVAKHVTINKKDVDLVSSETMNILQTDWFNKEHKQAQAPPEPPLSALFWSILIATTIFVVVVLALFMTSFMDKVKLAGKLYASYAGLVILTAILGTASYVYINRIVGVGELALVYVLC